MEVTRMSVRITSMVHRRVIHAVKPGNQRSRHARAAEYQPGGSVPVTAGAENSHSGVGIGDRRNVGHGPPGTACVLLPGWFGVDGAAAAASPVPGGFGKAASRA